MPLYGLVHDSPVIAAVQGATRRARKTVNAQEYVNSTDWVDEKILMPFLTKIIMKVHELEEQAKTKDQ